MRLTFCWMALSFLAACQPVDLGTGAPPLSQPEQHRVRGKLRNGDAAETGTAQPPKAKVRDTDKGNDSPHRDSVDQ